ncbi:MULTISPECIES: hypothetical protein [Calothrix]|uniref:Uncharacterized protein n=1 Tax=Calothrix parietina FACHB-288 TaxID=2692896 RepID=A0ABR8AHT8_9CYAN|nr:MULTISPECIES: hypothetical protein [Calothrix]MBD2199610.1 hypothetical protein [Calothrix parietina FACHB-288]
MPNAPCPMPNAQCPMPNAQCPMPNAQCPKTKNPTVMWGGLIFISNDFVKQVAN